MEIIKRLGSNKNTILNNTISSIKKAGVNLGYWSSKNLIKNNNLTKKNWSLSYK
jgi:parallel beta-helix repeat protein